MAPDRAALAAKLITFATVAMGALGSLLGGLFADRLGRTTLTMLAMAVSGSCAATVGFLFGADPWLLTAVCLVWGFTVVADSAQFSASVAELASRELVGTMLTLQTALGFSLTLITIHLMPLAVELLGWRFAFHAPRHRSLLRSVGHGAAAPPSRCREAGRRSTLTGATAPTRR